MTYTPNLNFNGIDTFTYDITDGNGGSDTGTLTITVTAVNDKPVANDDTATTAEDVTLNNIDVLSNDTDVDGDTLSVTGDHRHQRQCDGQPRRHPDLHAECQLQRHRHH